VARLPWLAAMPVANSDHDQAAACVHSDIVRRLIFPPGDSSMTIATTANRAQASDASGEMDALWGEQAERSVVDARLRRFLDDKYAMFIHWGLYAELGGEWRGRTYYGIGEWIMSPAMADIAVADYKALAQAFDPTEFDASAIVGLARDAGMRCIVITAKHHEGFAMFDSQVSDFTITRATPFGRDPLRELADACQAEGIQLGFYYSQFQDWTEPDGGGSRCAPADGSADFDRYFDAKVLPQVTELLTRYGPIALVWFDTPGNMNRSYSQRLVDLVHDLQPECLVNSRVGNGLGDYSSLGDMEIPAKTPQDGVYECIDTTNDSWAYARVDTHWKPPSAIARSLVRVAARGCRFMLNIGPAGDGTVPAVAVRSLTEAGAWVHANAEAIYATDASPFPPFSWGDCTVNGRHLYVHIFERPSSGCLHLAALANRVEQAQVLNSGEAVPFTQDGDCVSLNLKTIAQESMITVLRLALDGTPQALHQDLTVDGETATQVLAAHAEVEGAAVETARWMETFGEWVSTEHLTAWSGPEAEASWQLNVLAAGYYTVAVEYACDEESEGGEWRLTAAGDELTFVALDTGLHGRSEGRRQRIRYRTVEEGVILLERGRQVLRLAPRSEVSGGIHVSRLTLSPWA
jgi:alpha-L-fucosidase